MSIHFSPERWEKVRKDYTLWWEGKLERPLIKIVVEDAYIPERPRPSVPLLSQQTCCDLSYSADEIIDGIDYELSKYEFMGDAFPYFNFDTFGPGVLSAFCGARLDNSSGRVWFFPAEKLDIEDIHIQYDPNNMWVQRIKGIYRAGLKRWNGQVLMGMPDLGGFLDVVAVFRGTEDLLMDLYDSPDEVLRVCGEAQKAWFLAYEDLSSVLQPLSGGYSDWSGLYSSTPSYITQCDFGYMIGLDMFKTFAIPFLTEASYKLSNTIYHLDGINQLQHLDDLLKIENLNAVQWVPGDGQPTSGHWVEVYQKILSGGKNAMVLYGLDDLVKVCEGAGSKGIYYTGIIKKSQVEEAAELLKRFQ